MLVYYIYSIRVKYGMLCFVLAYDWISIECLKVKAVIHDDY